jgi:hypothetical protein
VSMTVKLDASIDMVILRQCVQLHIKVSTRSQILSWLCAFRGGIGVEERDELGVGQKGERAHSQVSHTQMGDSGAILINANCTALQMEYIRRFVFFRSAVIGEAG